MIKMDDWELGKCYGWLTDGIGKLTDDPFIESMEYGESFIVGRRFLVFIDEDENVLSFVLDGYAQQSIYKLIWKG